MYIPGYRIVVFYCRGLCLWPMPASLIIVKSIQQKVASMLFLKLNVSGQRSGTAQWNGDIGIPRELSRPTNNLSNIIGYYKKIHPMMLR